MDLDLTVCGDRLAVLIDVRTSFAIGDNGFVVGDVFRHGDTKRLVTLDPAEAGKVIASGGGWLVRECWGSYVALFGRSDGEGVGVLRAPFGDLACVVVKTAYGVAVASDVALLNLLTEFTPSVDWDCLVRHLAVGELYGYRTALTGLRELFGVKRRTLGYGGEAIDAPWRIWDFADRGQHWADRYEAVLRVRDAVTTAVVSQAGRFGSVVLRLSGGLDSSIVAACLSNGRITDILGPLLVIDDHQQVVV